MPTRLFAAVLALAALIHACGPHSRPGEASADPARKSAPNGPPIASSFEVKVNDRVDFAFHVTNNAAKRIELQFASGLTHDIVVLDSIGREVWRWSDGRMVTQSLQTRVLESSETITYQAAWSPAERGRNYTAVVSLLSQNHPMERRVDFTVP